MKVGDIIDIQMPPANLFMNIKYKIVGARKEDKDIIYEVQPFFDTIEVPWSHLMANNINAEHSEIADDNEGLSDFQRCLKNNGQSY